jgi:Xaa-Pro aminopeptidase
MLTMHPTLLIGPADWDPTRMPREEFLGRIAALWNVCDRKVAGAIVFGSSRQHAELAWLTHFTPKLEPGLAIIPKHGARRLFVGGGVNMLPAAAPLTWVTELLPLREAAQAVAAWAREVGGAMRVVLIGGDAMPFDLHRGIVAELAAAGAADVTTRLAALMEQKSVRELEAIRVACATLDAAAAALEESGRAGAGAAAAILAAEQAANRRGAQDVRTLFSLDGGRTLVPFTAADVTRIDPLQAYVAVRHWGYWAEGFMVLATAPSDALASARATLLAAIAAARPGVSCRALSGALAATAPQVMHQVVARSPVAGMGLALEAPADGGGNDEILLPNTVYSLRAGIRDVGIVSAMIAVTATDADVLWPRSRP